MLDLNLFIEAVELKTGVALREMVEALKSWRGTAEQLLEHEDPVFKEIEQDVEDLWLSLGFEEHEAQTTDSEYPIPPGCKAQSLKGAAELLKVGLRCSNIFTSC